MSGSSILGKSGICITFDVSGMVKNNGAASGVSGHTNRRKQNAIIVATNCGGFATTVFAILMRFLKYRKMGVLSFQARSTKGGQ